MRTAGRKGRKGDAKGAKNLAKEKGAAGAPLNDSFASFADFCGLCVRCPIPRLSDARGPLYCNACTPATSQPPPAFDLDMFQTSRNELAPADGSSRIIPENSTLAR